MIASILSGMRARKPKKWSAWLITWEAIGEARRREIDRPRVVAILRPQIGDRTIRALLPVLFISESRLMFGEKIGYGLTPQNENHVRSDHGVIRCGGNPHLMARLVSDLYVEKFENTVWRQTLHWTERPKYDLDHPSYQTVEIVPARQDCEDIEYDRLWFGKSYLEEDRNKGAID